jgi:hypothetical protein
MISPAFSSSEETVKLVSATAEAEEDAFHVPLCTASIKPLMYLIAYSRPRVV